MLLCWALLGPVVECAVQCWLCAGGGIWAGTGAGKGQCSAQGAGEHGWPEEAEGLLSLWSEG